MDFVVWRRIKGDELTTPRILPVLPRPVSHPASSQFDVRHLRLVLALLVLSSFVSAQQMPDPQKPAESAAPPTANTSAITTFKSRSDLVLVPVVVRDHKGKRLAGLSKDMFSLEEDGKPQSVSLFEEVQAPGTEPAPAPALDRGYSNLPFDNASQVPLAIIVLDLLNTSPFQREDGREQIIRFLSKGLAPNQPVSLVCLTSKGVKPVYPFTTNTSSVIEALRKTPLGAETFMAGQNRGAGTPSPYRESMVLSTIGQIREIAQAYVGIPGRKTLILAAAALPQLATEGNIFDPSVFTGDLRQMWHSLIEANISIYTIHLMDWSRNPARRRGAVRNLDLRLTEFADSTGGNPCVEENGLMNCLAEAVNDSRSYYMLGFTVQPDDRKPGWRYLKVKVSVEHADVHARSGFYYGTPPLETPKRAQEMNALASPLPYSALPMYVKVESSTPPPSPGSAPAASGNKTTVEFLMTIPLSSIAIDPSRQNSLDLEIGAIALTQDTKEAAEFVTPVRGNPTPENLQQWKGEGLRLRAKLDLPAGTYDMRFFARDNNANQIGTVVFPLDVK